MKILALHLHKFIAYARLQGMPEAAITTAVKTPLPGKDDTAAIIGAGDFYAVINAISAYLVDEQFGIRVGHHLNLHTLGAIYRISLKTSTVEEAIYYCQAYLQQTLPLVRVTNTVHDNLHTIELHTTNNADAVNRIVLEATLVVVAREVAIVTGDDTTLQLYSPYCQPAYPPRWKKGERFAVQFEQGLMKAALKHNSHWGLETLIPEYMGLVESMQTRDLFSDRVKMAMLNMAQPALPDLETVADFFNQGARTFQRRLVEEGTSFRQLSEELKSRIAELFIRHERYSIADISYLLGYSGADAFIHSFKKWHGDSPARRREQLKRVNDSEW